MNSVSDAPSSSFIHAVVAVAAGIVALLVLGLVAGTQHPRMLSLGTPTAYVSAPVGVHFVAGVWVRQPSEIVLYAEVDGQPWAPRLYAVRPDGSGLRQLPINGTPDCAGLPRDWPSPLPDGRIVYVGDCSWLPRARGMDEQLNAIAYDPNTFRAERLLPYVLPPVTHALTFSPDESTGLALQDGTIGGTLYWLLPNRLMQASIPVPIPRNPQWSPDGRLIAFSAVPDTRGREGAGRLGLPASIYVMGSIGEDLRPIFEGIVDARPPSWSADSRYLLVPVDFSLREGDGADILIDVYSDRRYGVLSQADYGPGVVLWSPDNRQIAKVAWDGGDPNWHPLMKEGLYVFDASPLEPILRADGS